MSLRGWLPLFALLLMASGCGAPMGATTPGTPATGDGSVAVTYQFQGVESPTKVSLRLIDGASSDQACATLPYTPTAGVLTEQSNLPVSGSWEFTGVGNGSRWIVWAVGYNAAGVRVAEACEDLIDVSNDNVSDVFVQLNNKPLKLSGPFTTNMEVVVADIDSTTLGIIALSCSFIPDIPPTVCTKIIEALQILGDLDVEAIWTLNQNGDSVNGPVVWTKIEGIDVSSYQGSLANGQMVGEVAGATQLQIKTFQMSMNMAAMVLFLIEDVLAFPIPDPAIAQAVMLFLGPLMQGELTVPTGTGTLADFDTDGTTDQLEGILYAHTDFPDLGVDTDFEIAYQGQP